MVASIVLSRAALCCFLLLASCATTTPPRAHRPWSGALKTGVAFFTVGAVSVAVGAGMFGYALAHHPPHQDDPEFVVFAPGVAIFGIGIPFFVTGAVFTIRGALKPPAP